MTIDSLNTAGIFGNCIFLAKGLSDLRVGDAQKLLKANLQVLLFHL